MQRALRPVRDASERGGRRSLRCRLEPHNELFFRGFRRDRNTGTYQFGTRVYDPSKSAFLTPDSYRADDPASGLGVGVDQLTRNTYTYVNGDLVNLIDPDGHSPCKADGYPEFCKPYKDKKTQRAAVKDYYRRQFDKAIRGQARYGPCPGGAAGPCLLNVYVPGYPQDVCDASGLAPFAR